jgi:hypothetical protein
MDRVAAAVQLDDELLRNVDAIATRAGTSREAVLEDSVRRGLAARALGRCWRVSVPVAASPKTRLQRSPTESCGMPAQRGGPVRPWAAAGTTRKGDGRARRSTRSSRRRSLGGCGVRADICSTLTSDVGSAPTSEVSLDRGQRTEFNKDVSAAKRAAARAPGHHHRPRPTFPCAAVHRGLPAAAGR